MVISGVPVGMRGPGGSGIDRLQFYYQLYSFEMGQRQHVERRSQLPVTLVVALIPSLAYLLANGESVPAAVRWVYALLTLVSLIGIVVSCICLYAVLFPQKYKAVLTVQEFEDYRKTLVQHNEKHTQTTIGVDERFSEAVITQLAQAHHHNFHITKRRGEFLYYAMLSIGGTVVASAVSALLLQWDNLRSMLGTLGGGF